MSIEKRLQKIFRDVFADNDIELYADMSAKDIDDWDSLTHIQLILAIEKEFQVKFTLEEVTKMQTVGEFIDLIATKINK